MDRDPFYASSTIRDIPDRDAGGRVSVGGWLIERRALGQILFAVLADHLASIQIVARDALTIKMLCKIRLPMPMRVFGEIKFRTPGTRTPDSVIGNRELLLHDFELLSDDTPRPANLNIRIGQSYANAVHATSSLAYCLDRAGFVQVRPHLTRINYAESEGLAWAHLRHSLASAGVCAWYYFGYRTLIAGMSAAPLEVFLNTLRDALMSCVHIKFDNPTSDSQHLSTSASLPSQLGAELITFDPRRAHKDSIQHELHWLAQQFTHSFELFDEFTWISDLISKRMPLHHSCKIALSSLGNTFNAISESEAELSLLTSIGVTKGMGQLFQVCRQDTELLAARLAVNEAETDKEIFDVAIKARHRASIRPADPLQDIFPMMGEYGMTPSEADRLLAILPTQREVVLAQPLPRLFSYIWSLLGSDNVRALLLNDRCLTQLDALVRARYINEYRQLLYLTPDAIAALYSLQDRATGQRSEDLLRRCVASFPTLCSTFVQSLQELNIDVERHSVRLMSMLMSGCITPKLVEMILADSTINPDEVQAIAVQSAAGSGLRNSPLDIQAIAEAFRSLALQVGVHAPDVSKDVALECVFALYKPVTVSYAHFRRMMVEIPDCTSHWSANEISCGGNLWDSHLGAYRFGDRALFPSKSVASFWGKASAGICTALDIDLFRRIDHLHLNIFDCKNTVVVGNVQMYVIHSDDRRYLLVRGINPSASYVTRDNAGEIVAAAIRTALSVAMGSNFHALLLSDNLGVWNTGSARPEVRAVLAPLYQLLPVVRFSHSVELFNFRGNSRSVNNGFRIWP